MGTMWCLFDPTPSGWCKTDAHSTDFASNWLRRLPAGSISTWEDLTNRFLAQFFPPGRTSKLRNDILMFQQHQAADGKLPDKSDKESWALLEDLALYDNESWNNPRDFAKPVKEISMPQYVPSTSDRHLIELKNQVQRLMEAHLAPNQPIHVNKIASSCEICSGHHDTQYCMENPEQAFDEYASSHTDEAGGDSKPFDTLADLGSCVNLIPLNLFKKLKIGLLKVTKDVLGIVKNIEVHVGKLRLFEDFHVVDTEREPTYPLLVGRGFLATANTVIDCKKAKITVGEGLTRSIFGVRELDLGEENVPYWTTIGKRESYKPRTSEDDIGARPLYFAKRDFQDNHSPREWEISRDVEVNPFKDILVFRKMIEFLGAIPINLKRNMWDSEEIIDNKMDWDRPPKEGDGAWHIRIELIDPDKEKFDRAFQSILTTKKLSPKENPSDILKIGNIFFVFLHLLKKWK
ncbi:MAK10-like protein [Tanacetum coccineum]